MCEYDDMCYTLDLCVMMLICILMCAISIILILSVSYEFTIWGLVLACMWACLTIYLSKRIVEEFIYLKNL